MRCTHATIHHAELHLKENAGLTRAAGILPSDALIKRPVEARNQTLGGPRVCCDVDGRKVRGARSR